MDEIEFIKEMAAKAEGFRYIEKNNDIECPDQMCIDVELIIKDKVRFPLLLQRAIEWFNSFDDTEYFIQLNLNSVCIYDCDDEHDVAIFEYNDPEWPTPATSKEIDLAKEKALRYIFSQGRNPNEK